MAVYRDVYVNDIKFTNLNDGRYVVHFPIFTRDVDCREITLEQEFRAAYNRARKIGFKRYRAKWYGGGFVINLLHDARSLKDIANEIKAQYGTKLVY